MVLKHISSISDTQAATLLLAPFSFQHTTPDRQIGMALSNGFLTGQTDIQVPVRTSPYEASFRLVPASNAVLSSSESLEEFLTLPLVPFNLAQNGFFSQLKSRSMIHDIIHDQIVSTLASDVIGPGALIHLLRWLRKEHSENKAFLRLVLRITRFQDGADSSIVSMKQIQYYDVFQVSKHLPLPADFLPAVFVASQFSPRMI